MALDSLAQVFFQFSQIFSLGRDAPGLIWSIPACGKPTACFIALNREGNFLGVHNEIMRSPQPDCKPLKLKNSALTENETRNARLEFRVYAARTA